MGKPLVWVQNGDWISVSVAARELTLFVDDAELARRRAAQPVTPPTAERGYRKLFLQSVTQADQGADFDFLMPPASGTRIPR
ncbi:MAG: dihydroxy-acid dehydratase [Pseudomonadota bacterium]|nr:dihydroxy-acid dehydratase [Pseudomonadota bacterium]